MAARHQVMDRLASYALADPAIAQELEVLHAALEAQHTPYVMQARRNLYRLIRATPRARLRRTPGDEAALVEAIAREGGHV